MTYPLVPVMRLGTVTALVTGPPPRVRVTLGGDTVSTVDAPYLDSYDPAVADTVQVLVNQGAPLVLGRAAGTTATWPQSGTGTSTVTAGSSFGTGTAVVFPVAYAAAPVVIAVHDSTVGGVVGNFGVRITARSTTGFTIVPFRTDGTTAGVGGNVVGFGWTAVGS